MKIFRTPSIVRKLLFKRTWGFSMDKNEVYLTFDDGPHPDITPWVLDYLKAQNIKACFFCVGENVKRYPELFKRILNEGHQVGNHTMYHTNSHKTSFKEYEQSIREAAAHIPSNLFRPPYGRLSTLRARKIAKQYKIIVWSWLSYDFDDGVSISEILSKAEKQIVGGDILVVHDNPKFTLRQKELLPKLIDVIRKKGLIFGRIPN
jgi:peptidoglycan/xylan/chitin deacetylase (PgdA/CDA1 family)